MVKKLSISLNEILYEKVLKEKGLTKTSTYINGVLKKHFDQNEDYGQKEHELAIVQNCGDAL